jgi:tetratricopeptide (TPR) repeat protein
MQEVFLNKTKLVFGLAGLVVGFAISFFWAKSINKTGLAKIGNDSPMAAAGAAGPASAGGQQAAMGSVREKLETAKNNPNDFNAQVDAASVYAQIGRTADAVPFLEKAYKLDAAQSVKLGIPPYIAQYYSSQNSYAEAEKWYRQDLQAKPDDYEAMIELGATFFQREPPDPDKAIDYLQSALKGNPRDAHALMHLTEAYLVKKDARSAEETLGRLRAANPTNNSISMLQTKLDDLKAGRPVTIPKD